MMVSMAAAGVVAAVVAMLVEMMLRIIVIAVPGADADVVDVTVAVA